MRASGIIPGGRVCVKFPERWSDTEGNPIPTTPLIVVRIQERKGYKEPFIVLEGERFFKASDLRPLTKRESDNDDE